MQTPSPASVEVMYELVNQKEDGVQQVVPGTLMLPSSQLQALQTSSGDIKLYTQPNCSEPEGAINDKQQLRITSVSVVVDLKPDPSLAILGSVPAAAWTIEDAADIEAVKQTIEAAGQGYIENARSEWVQVGATRFAGSRVHGYTATTHCEEQANDDSDCDCTVELPTLYSDTTSTTSLFHTAAVPTLTIDVLLRPCVPLQVVEAVQEVVSAHLPIRTAACVSLMTTHVSGDLVACMEHPAPDKPPPNMSPTRALTGNLPAILLYSNCPPTAVLLDSPTCSWQNTAD